MEEYIECKKRIAGQINVLNRDDPVCRTLDLPNTVWFSGRDARAQNIAAVKTVCGLLGLDKKDIARACRPVRLPHRMEHVKTIRGVTFINDSKATNIAACVAACKSFKKPVNLILGGLGKGQDFRELFEKLPQNVESVFVFGHAADEIIAAAAARPINRCQTLAEAVTRAAQFPAGGVVLFSPACSSFDMFKNYEDRGDMFKKLVRDLHFHI
jgi:UDP-N-acetylmuramoylalanine--D-glutamate ligase